MCLGSLSGRDGSSNWKYSFEGNLKQSDEEDGKEVEM